jgi:hypothetical protein
VVGAEQHPSAGAHALPGDVLAANDCTFSMLASTADAPFIAMSVRHLLRMCAFHFQDVVIVVDDLPKDGHDAVEARGLLAILEGMHAEGIVSRILRLSTVHENERQLSQKYFGCVLPRPRDRRGIPLLGWVAGLEDARTDFVVHFDSDILLHQRSGHSWLTEAMTLLRQDASAMFVAPRPGPPAADGSLQGQQVAPTRDENGNFRFKQFSSRRFLVSKRRFDALLPTPLLYTSRRDRVLMQLGYGNALQMWEECVSSVLRRSSYYRVHLANPNAWSVHCKEHSPRWLAALPAILERVEAGEFPEAQAGHYNLQLSHWV